jgi:hypothetical protein
MIFAFEITLLYLFGSREGYKNAITDKFAVFGKMVKL